MTVANNTKARAGQEGTLHIRMTLSSNPLPVDGKILIRLPGEYCNDVQTGYTCGSLSVTDIEGMDGQLTAATPYSGDTITLSRTSATNSLIPQPLNLMSVG